jgi:hypothetical protein
MRPLFSGLFRCFFIGLFLFQVSYGFAAASLAPSLVIGSDWGDGYCAKIYLKNTGDTATTTWSLRIDLGESVLRDNFSSTITGTTGMITATPGEFNAIINPAAEKNFGFCALGAARPSIVSVTAGATVASSKAASSIPASSKAPSSIPASSVAPSSVPASSEPASSTAPSSEPASSIAPSSIAASSSSKSSSSSAASYDLKHPGLLTSLSTLNAIKTRVARGDQPWKSEIDAMRASVLDAPLRTPPTKMLQCGGHNRDANGNKVIECDWPAEQGIYAYTFALLGYLTNSKADSEKAIQFIMQWSDGRFKGFEDGCENRGCVNAKLQAGWVAPWFANAAEILRYTYSGWTSTHTRAVDSLMNKLLPLVENDKTTSPGNWMHARIEAHMAIAIWKDDKAMFDLAVTQWKGNSPSYFYIASDGAYPPQPRSITIPLSSFKTGQPIGWWGVKNFIPGMSMETCRDINHQGLGVRPILNSLAMAKNQGVDMLAGNDMRERLATFFEVQSQWIKDKKDPAGACNEAIVFQPPSTLMDRAKAVNYQMGYTLIRNLAYPLPKTLESIGDAGPVRASRWLQKPETLTHYHVAP